MSNLSNINKLENIINTFAYYIEYIWEKNSKNINIIRHSKSWWNKEYNRSLSAYRTLRKLEDWKIFRRWSRIPNMLSLISRFKKSLTRNEGLGN